MSSALEDTFAFQLTAAGLTGYVREYVAIPGRKFRFDFAFIAERLLVEIQGGVWSGGAHGRPTGITRDMDKLNQAQINHWRVLQFDVKAVKSGEALQTTEKLINQSKEQLTCTKS